MELFVCKIKYDRTMEDGLIKSVTEQYIVDALTPGEAESRITEEMTLFVSGEFNVESISKMKVADVFEGLPADKWYKVKVGFITIDEKTEKEKLVNQTTLVAAGDFHHALSVFATGMKDAVCDYRILSTTETKILDFFKHKQED